MIRKSRKQGGKGKRSLSSANISLSGLPCARTYHGHLTIPMRRRHPITKENPLVPAAHTSNLPHPQLPHHLMTPLSSECSNQKPCLFGNQPQSFQKIYILRAKRQQQKRPQKIVSRSWNLISNLTCNREPDFT